MASLKRIMREYENFQKEKNNLNGIQYKQINEDDPYGWYAIITGPSGSSYENCRYKLKIKFPLEYPFKPPIVEFITPIIHPNVHEHKICLDILKEQWSPAQSVVKILLSLQSFLDEPNPDSALSHEAMMLWRKSKDEYKAQIQAMAAVNVVEDL